MGLEQLENFLLKQSENSDVIRVGSPNALEKFYDKIKYKYDLNELKDILECDDNMLIESGAGSGKTTTLLLKIIRDILAGKLLDKHILDGQEILIQKKILVSTFLKSGAEDMLKKFRELIAEYNIEGIKIDNVIRFSTIHSEVYGALKDMGININIVTDEEARKYLRAACEKYKIKPSLNRSGGKILTNEELGDISSIVTYARNRLDKSRYEHPLMFEYNIGELELKGVIQEFNLQKRVRGVQDFEDLEETLYDGYRNPNVVNFVKQRYKYVYIDEFQDTSQLQYAILKPYLESADGFIAIGDGDQCIYSFRGSDITLIQNRLVDDFNPTVKQLTVNRRCGSNILNPIIPSIEKNSNRRKKNLHSATNDGEVEIVVDNSINYLSKSIKEDLSKSEDIGILGRTNADLLIPAVLLLIEGYNSFGVSRSISLTEKMPKHVLGAMTLITKRYSNDFESLLKLFVNPYNYYQVTKLCETLSTSPMLSIYNIDLEDLRYSAPDLFPILRMLRDYRRKYEETQEDHYLVDAYIELLDIMETEVYNGKTIYAQRARDFVYYIKKIIREHDTFKNKSLEQIQYMFLDEFVKELDKRRPLKSVKSKKDNVLDLDKSRLKKPFIQISTVHDAKGKQWANVYIWNDVDGCFPNSVGNRQLNKEEFEEERRIHYIAWTRATKKLVVFTRSDRKPGFLQECDLTNVKLINPSNARIDLEIPEQNKIVDTLIKKDDTFIEQFKKVQNTKSNEKKENWVKFVEEYIRKYCSFQYICTKKGNILDGCLTKLNGVDGLINYLRSFELGNYPIDLLDSAVSDILESFFNNL